MELPTIYDIAQLAGVSKSTVSRVLNQQEGVGQGTRERVLRIAAELGFTPSINAKGLRGQSQLVGMLMPFLQWTAVLDMIRGIANQMEKYPAYEMILYSNTPDKGEYEGIIERVLTRKLIAGLVAMIYEQSPDHLISLYQNGFPVVLIDTVSLRAMHLPWIGADQHGGAYKAVRHLIMLGHRRIGYVQGILEYPSSHERFQGYLQAHNEAGLAPDPNLVQQGNMLWDGGYRAGKALLTAKRPPDAIFCCNDYMAQGVLAVAKELDIRIPEDLAVVGFNDDPIIDGQRPVLTTISQPYADMGRCAAELLMSMIDPQYPFSDEWKVFAVGSAPVVPKTGQKGARDMALQIQLPTRLVIRETCGANLIPS